MPNQHQITTCPITTKIRIKQGGVCTAWSQNLWKSDPLLYTQFVYFLSVVIKPAQATEKPLNSPILLQICRYNTFYQHKHAVRQKSYRQDILHLYFCEVSEPQQKHTDLLSESLKDKEHLALENHLEKYSPQPLPVICSLEMVLWKLAVVGTMDPVFFLLLQSLLLLCTSSHSLGILSHMVLLKKEILYTCNSVCK